MAGIRLNKYLAECGICSRREGDRLIDEGRVCVDGEVAQMGQQIQGTETITVNGKVIRGKNETVVLLYHKPVGVVCTEKDPHAKRTIATEIKYPVRVTYAGRLDKDSQGLLLLTNDGDLIEEMMRGANGHEKEYVVKVDKNITPQFLQKMETGIYLKDLEITTRECKIEKIGERTFRIILTQGLNRQIRRMCQALGYQVLSLKRERIVNLVLGNLPVGTYREATVEEIRELRGALKTGAKRAGV